ncbi:hypothetical protein B7L88_gp092 [Rhizobium phage RHEph10]|uniref:hypothetical protein n=1 Tax=Rhizobium phage RHEph10 TaxID=1220717 RepID=UPI0002AB6487|nr:hypothetical protein B7L88_gp092 [Rhizobium phage RHEph10]AGC36196.1 hypothetical protein RHEph10_gp153 [Rhizobium phage RHEph10]
MFNLRLQLRLLAADAIRFVVIALIVLIALLIGAGLFFVGLPLILLILLVFALWALAGSVAPR